MICFLTNPPIGGSEIRIVIGGSVNHSRLIFRALREFFSDGSGRGAFDGNDGGGLLLGLPLLLRLLLRRELGRLKSFPLVSPSLISN